MYTSVNPCMSMHGVMWSRVQCHRAEEQARTDASHSILERHLERSMPQEAGRHQEEARAAHLSAPGAPSSLSRAPKGPRTQWPKWPPSPTCGSMPQEVGAERKMTQVEAERKMTQVGAECKMTQVGAERKMTQVACET
jgi:hypothetical protein